MSVSRKLLRGTLNDIIYVADIMNAEVAIPQLATTLKLLYCPTPILGAYY